MGIAQMMAFFERRYGKKYAPNTREAVRRQTVHQLLQAGIVHINPDEPDRPTNSGKTVYQISKDILPVLRSYGTDRWGSRLAKYHMTHPPLQELYDRRSREGTIMPVPHMDKVRLSGGRHNRLTAKVWSEFRPRFVSCGRLLYAGDTAKKMAYVDNKCTAALRMDLDPHGKLPDMIIHDTKRDWVFLIEAVTSHGPIGPQRRLDLEKLFHTVAAGLVFVTVFEDMAVMKRHLANIAWDTEVWIAASPDHLIHFDGKRLLFPRSS